MIQAGHKLRALGLKVHLGPNEIRPLRGDENWMRSHTKSHIQFALFGPENVFSDRRIGGRCPVVALISEQPSWTDSNKPWVAWLEEWESAGNGTFRIVSASMTFFIGRANRNDKLQLLRAEWDLPDYRGLKAAQPHWHVDSPSQPSPEDIGLESELETHALIDLDAMGNEPESNTRTESTPDISGFHLGMAGWHHGPRCPECWQLPITADAVTNWAIQTILYAKSQMTRLL
jgi:hypothetical protein